MADPNSKVSLAAAAMLQVAADIHREEVELARALGLLPADPTDHPAMRDCVCCPIPFFSKSSANVVCPSCVEDAAEAEVEF